MQTFLCFKNGILVGGFNHLEKYESQWEGWHPICVYIYIIIYIYTLWKIKFMFETTNQNHSPYICFGCWTYEFSVGFLERFQDLPEIYSPYPFQLIKLNDHPFTDQVPQKKPLFASIIFVLCSLYMSHHIYPRVFAGSIQLLGCVHKGIGIPNFTAAA